MKSLSLLTASLLLALPCSLRADGEGDSGYCYLCDDCDETPTYSGSPNPGVDGLAEAKLLPGKVGFNTIHSITGNAWRRVRDLSFPNSPGGLSFERFHITRATNVTPSYGVFCQESGWLHNWQFVIRDYGYSLSTDPYRPAGRP